MSRTHSIPVDAEPAELANASDGVDAGSVSPKASDRHRVLFIVESGTDVRLVEGLEEISSLAILARKIERGREISQEPSVPVPVTVGPSARPRFAELVFRTLIAKRHEYDACIVQGYGLAALAANFAAKLTRKPTMMFVCSATEEYYGCRTAAGDGDNPYRGFEHRILQALARLNARSGGSYVVLSRHLEAVVRSHGTRVDVYVARAYGVDVDVFKPSATPKAVLKAELGLPTNGTVIFSSSRVAPEKDTTTLLAAVAELLKADRDLWLLCLTGRHQQFLKLAREFNVAERVIVGDAVHPTKMLPQYYQASDMCVQVSRAEGLGFSPLEAIACGTPVVATAIGGLRETIIDGVTGWAHAVGNPKDLAAKITEVMDGPEEAKRRAANGRAMVCRDYERSAVFRALAECIHAATEKSRSSCPKSA
jgi:glycosyltransferase involved in cell wall biosynthesis